MNLRPTGITVSALALGWLAFGGLGNAAIRGSSDSLVGVAALLYAVPAAIAAVGLWRLRDFGLAAFRIWCAFCALWTVVFAYRFGDWGRTAIVALLIGLILFLWHGYLSRAMQSAAQQANEPDVA